MRNKYRLLFVSPLLAPPGVPTELTIVFASAVSVTLRWTSGRNGGYEQTFSLTFRVAGQPWPTLPQIASIPDPGEGQSLQYKVYNLKQSTIYELRLKAVNEKHSSPYSRIIQGKTRGENTFIYVNF